MSRSDFLDEMGYDPFDFPDMCSQEIENVRLDFPDEIDDDESSVDEVW